MSSWIFCGDGVGFRGADEGVDDDVGVVLWLDVVCEGRVEGVVV